MDFATLVRSRLQALGREQKDLARAVQVTDSYISQLLTRRKVPPDRARTDIYPKMEAFLELRPGELEKLVEIERTEEIRRRLEQPPEPLFREFRDLVLRKCSPEKHKEVRIEFEAHPFGSLERLVTRKLLEIVQVVARQELDDENWIRLADHVKGLSHEELRVMVLEFLDSDVFTVSHESCLAFLDPLVDSWSVDLDSLRLDITLNRQLVDDPHRTVAFVEGPAPSDSDPDPALAELLEDPILGSDISDDELRLLRSQRFLGRRPTKLYYYRALQNLRDPLHFRDE